MSAKASSQPDGTAIGSSQASEEIYAYIVARDLALAEAERQMSDLALNRAFLANQLLENCLKPVRHPYQAQALPEAEAVRERQRCKAISVRLARLRSSVGTDSRRSSIAA